MATVEGTTVEFGIASNASTGFTGAAIITDTSGGTRAETKQIKNSAGEAMSFVIFDESKEVSVSVVCDTNAEIGTNGSVITLANFAGGTSDLNGKYYLTNSSLNYSNESEMTASLTLLRLEDGAFSGSTATTGL
tara:strand:+ start:5467 stop:5868 length:402 start_codon:yes stop_codon:yes gene_type:complete